MVSLNILASYLVRSITYGKIIRDVSQYMIHSM